MIYTSCYENFKTELYKGISISGDRGKNANWNKTYYKKLAPKKQFFNIWHNNKGKIDELENNYYYITEYYKEVLSKLNPETVYRELENSFLLCYEDNLEFCHRHIVAAWLEIFLDVKIDEVKVTGLYIKIVERPTYIKQMLEKIIKENINMRGFNSLRALYLFELGENMEKQANELEEKNNKNYDYLRQGACYMRCAADYAESEYNIKILTKKGKYE